MFCFLSKRLWLVAAGVFLVTSMGVGTVWSYFRTAHCELGKAIRDIVPISFELNHLEQAIQDLIPEIRANQKVAAQIDVEAEFLAKEIQATEDSLAKAKAQMRKLREALDEDREVYEFGGRKFTRPEVEQDLAQRLERYDSTEVQMAAKRKILHDRRQTLAAATNKIRQYRQQHELLVEKAESLKGELKLVELAQEPGTCEFNATKFGQAKELAERVEKRIRMVQKLVDSQRQALSGEIPVEADARPVAQRFDEYFQAKK